MSAPREKIVQRFSELAPQSVDWIWPGRIAAGALTLIDGDPSLGKSLLTLDLAARLTTGRPLPDGVPLADRTPVLVLCAEDSQSATVRPRLEAAGADLDAVTFLRCRAGGCWRWPSFPADCDLLRESLEETAARLVIIDPLLAFLSANVCSLNHDLVRRALEPLREVAEQTSAGMVLVRHLTKAGHGQAALYRGTGATSIVGTARCAFLAGRHPEDAGLRLLACIKSNLAASPPTLGYRIASDSQGRPRVDWVGPVPVTADELGAARRVEWGQSLDHATAFLHELLSHGPATCETVRRLARGHGVADRTLKRAKAELHVVSEQKHEQERNVWYWSLPHDRDSDRIMTDLFPDTLAQAAPATDQPTPG